MNVLLRLLLSQFKALPSLPDKLYIQMDNCGRENKNQFVFALLALLVEKGIFHEVFEHIKYFQSWVICYYYLSWMGHTHEDIDALFGHVSLTGRDCSALNCELQSYPSRLLKEDILKTLSC